MPLLSAVLSSERREWEWEREWERSQTDRYPLRSPRSAVRPGMASWRESSLPGKGRVLLAARDVARGDIVLQAVDTNSDGSSYRGVPLPWMLVLAPQDKALVCGPDGLAVCLGCLGPLPSSAWLECPDCGWPCCTAHCHALPAHQLECAVLAACPAVKPDTGNLAKPQLLYRWKPICNIDVAVSPSAVSCNPGPFENVIPSM